MTYGELILKSSSEVRSNSNLTSCFINAYKNVFGHVPTCSGCAINNELGNLIKHIKTRNLQEQEIEVTTNNITMVDNSKTFVLNPSLQDYMLAYRDKNKVIRRKFVSKLTDEYVVAYLTNGTAEEIEERKKKFKVLPLALQEKTAKVVLKTKEKKNK